MNSTLFLFLSLIGVGAVFTGLAIRGWRYRNEDSISVIEASILTVTDTRPLPKTQFDRLFQFFQIGLMAILGPALVAAGSYGLLLTMDIL